MQQHCNTKQQIIEEKPLIKPPTPIYPKKHSRMVDRLGDALREHDRPDLENTTILSKNIQEIHRDIIYEKFKRKLIHTQLRVNKNIIKQNKILVENSIHPLPIMDTQNVANDYVRFVTFLFEVTELDSNAALRSSIAMTELIEKCAKNHKGLSILGAIEVEIISIPVMEQLVALRSAQSSIEFQEQIDETRTMEIKNISDDKNFLKLETCKNLGINFENSVYRTQRCQFLIHFHGVMIARDKAQFDQFRHKLKAYPQFNRTPRQIEIKPLSRTWGNENRTPEVNLKHIANYITKGASSRTDNNSPSLKLKFRFSYDQLVSKVESETLDKINQSLVKLITNNEHTYCTEILTHNEIFELVITIDKLMDRNTEKLRKNSIKARQGYLIEIGRW